MFSSNLSQYSGDGVTVSLQEFAHFLRQEQAQPDTLHAVASIMRDFLQVRHFITRYPIRIQYGTGNRKSADMRFC